MNIQSQLWGIAAAVHNGRMVARARRAGAVHAAASVAQRRMDLAAVERLQDALADEQRRSADLEDQLALACSEIRRLRGY